MEINKETKTLLPGDDRLAEIQAAFVRLGGTVVKQDRTPSPTGEEHHAILRMDISIPEALISLGVCKTEEEAEYFLSTSIFGALFAASEGRLSGQEMLHSFIKMGFYIGTALANKPKETN